jgi:hypothetical protein
MGAATKEQKGEQMNSNEDKRALVEAIAEGIKRGLAGIKLVDETPHPVNGLPISSKTIGRFIDDVWARASCEKPGKFLDLKKRAKRKARQSKKSKAREDFVARVRAAESKGSDIIL